MKALKLKKFLLWTAVLVFTLIVALSLAVGVIGTTNSGKPAAAAGGPKIVLKCSPEQIPTTEKFQEFTITVRIEGVSSVASGVFGANIKVTPVEKESLIFIGFLACKSDDVPQSALLPESVEGETIVMEAMNSTNPIKKDFDVGQYKFKLKTGENPGELHFDFEDNGSANYDGDPLEMESGTFTVTFRDPETDNSLSGLSISANGKTIIENVADEQTVEEEIPYGDRELKISATRGGKFSKIKVVDSVNNKTLFVEDAKDLKNQSLGKLDPGEHNLVITVTSESGEAKTYTVKLKVGEAPPPAESFLPKPSDQPAAATGTYNGSPIDFTPTGMADLASKVNFEKVNPDGSKSPATINDFKQTNAGPYKIVATPKDGFFWEGGGVDPIEYSFEVEKAKLTATSGGDGKLPNFSSESFKGSLNDVIDYKYYSDEDCTQEIAKSDLEPGQTYYAKPVLKPGAEANFEFGDDSTTQKFVNDGFSYLEPTASENFFTKKFLGLPVWAWFVILFVILLLIIILIIVLKKKKNDDEDRIRNNGVAGGAGVAAIAADSALSAKTEKLDDRLRAMEDKAHEREITRYREEIEKAKRDADLKNAAAATGVAAGVAADSALSMKTERLEERLRDMERQARDREREIEHEAYEREVARYKEEVERAKKDAELKSAAAAVAPAVAAGTVADSAFASRAEKLEERIREMEREAREREHEIEREAYERELARYKEELAKVKMDASVAATTVGAVAGTTGQSDASNLRIAQLEDELRRYQERMHDEMRRRDDEQRAVERRTTEERIAQMKLEAEREVERIREEARRNSGSFNNQPQAAAFATTEMIARLTQLEEGMKRREEAMREEMRRQQDAQREAERKAAEERIAQMKAEAEREVERLKQEARETAKAMNQPQAAVLASNDMAARFAQLEEGFKRREEEMREQMRRQEEAQRESERKNAEARIAQMKADAEHEAMRIKEEAERLKEEARKTAEDIKRQSEIAASRQPIAASGLHIKTEGDMDAETAAVLRDYQDRMRKMEQELQEQRMTNLMRENTEKARKEMEEASKMRRHEEEMQRLRDLQDYERRQRQEMQSMPYMQNMPNMQYMQQQPYGGQYGASDAFMRQQQDLEAQRLKLLEERLKQREMEVQMLRSQSFGMPQQPFGQPYPAYGQPQPGYAPVQPGYAPVQPGYGAPVQQPGYAPNPYDPMGGKK